jgi:hypothetical protein
MFAAARIDGWGGPPLIDEVRDPEAGEGESFAQVTAAAGAQIDLTDGSGTLAFRPDSPVSCPGRLSASTPARSPDAWRW